MGFLPGAKDDVRYAQKHVKMLESLVYDDCLDKKVNLNRVNLEVMKPWIGRRLVELLDGIEDEILIQLVYNLLEDAPESASTDESGKVVKEVNPREIQLQLSAFLTPDKAKQFMSELWKLLSSAQDNPEGIPEAWVEEMKLDFLKKQQAMMAGSEVARRLVVRSLQQHEQETGKEPARNQSNRQNANQISNERYAKDKYSIVVDSSASGEDASGSASSSFSEDERHNGYLTHRHSHGHTRHQSSQGRRGIVDRHQHVHHSNRERNKGVDRRDRREASPDQYKEPRNYRNLTERQVVRGKRLGSVERREQRHRYWDENKQRRASFSSYSRSRSSSRGRTRGRARERTKGRSRERYRNRSRDYTINHIREDQSRDSSRHEPDHINANNPESIPTSMMADLERMLREKALESIRQR